MAMKNGVGPKFLSLVVFGLLLCVVPAFALVQPTINVGAAFIANDPAEITFVDLDKIIDYTKARLLKDRTVLEQDVLDFWQSFRQHGAPQAGLPGNAAKMAVVVPGGDTPATGGVIAVTGSFDKKVVLEMIGRHYEEHVQEHMTAEQQKEHGIGRVSEPIGGYATHMFVLPQRNREVHIVDLGNTVVFATHKKGDTKLLLDVINVLTGKTPVRSPANRTSKVTFNFAPTAAERDQLVKDMDDAYQRYASGKLDYRRGVARFRQRLTNIVAAQKVKQVEGFVADLENAVLEADRTIDGSADSKNLSLTLNFRSEATAKAVKAGIVKHLVAEVKRPVNQGFQAALENPQIILEGRSVIVRVPLLTEDDQMYAFSIMATYAARGLIATRGTSVTRTLRAIADQEANLGRNLSACVSTDLSRSPFFSFSRKFSLMYSNLKIKSNVRSCEDVYADLKDNPKVLASSMEKLVKATTRNFDEIDSLITMKTADYGKKDAKQAETVQEIIYLRTLRTEMALNAKRLITTLRSPAYRNAAGALEPKFLESLGVLTAKTWMSLPKAAVPVVQAGAPAATTAAVAAAPAEPTVEEVAIPAGMTLEKAYAEYQAVLKTYVQASMANDAAKMQSLYSDLDLKNKIYHALLAKKNAGK